MQVLRKNALYLRRFFILFFFAVDSNGVSVHAKMIRCSIHIGNVIFSNKKCAEPSYEHYDFVD